MPLPLLRTSILAGALAGLLAACATGATGGAPSSGGGRLVEAFDPTASALSAAFRKPTPEGAAQSALADHANSAAFLEQYPATRRAANCGPTGPCAHRVSLVYVDGRGRPVGEPPSCGLITATLDRAASGRVAVQSVSWDRRGGVCGK